MLKEKIIKARQKSGGVIGKSCKFVHEHRRTIGYLTVVVVADAIEQTMDGKELDYNNDADVDEYISRMKEIQQETLGYPVIEFSVKKEK